MELRAVRLGPYKGQLTPQWQTIAPLTVLFGRNGAGKTNVIAALSDELFSVRGDTLVDTRAPGSLTRRMTEEECVWRE